MSTASNGLLLKALKDHRVTAKVVDCDHYRIRGGLAVETDFIVAVKPASGTGSTELFETFTLSKAYSAFRTLAQQLKQAGDECQRKAVIDELPAQVIKLIKYCQLVFQLVDAQRTAYLGKVNYLYVKILAKQRKQIIDDVLSATFNYFPKETASHSLLHEIATIVETFLLTDHVVLEDCHEEEGGDAAAAADKGQHHERKISAASLDNLNPLAWIGGIQGFASNSKSKPHRHQPAAASPPGVGASVVVVPISRRGRRSGPQRDLEEEELCEVGKEAMLLVDDDRPATVLLPNFAKPLPTTVRAAGGGTALLGSWMDANPWTFLATAAAAVAVLQKAAGVSVTVDADIFLLCVFASFCLGLHTPRPVTVVGGFDRRPTMKGTTVRADDRSGRKLLRRSMIAMSPTKAVQLASLAAGMPMAAAMEDQLVALEEEEEEPTMCSPMPRFPPGAELGSHLNCWASPEASDFHVRGPNYLSDKKKVPSGDYLFPCRGVDLFLTDTCPQNVGRNAGVMGGRLRDVPTFIINFRLPWGVLLFYNEIPSKFIPFLEASTAGDAAVAKLMPVLKEMTPPERTVARWLMNDTEHKNKTLKIVPVVVDGPWVVKCVVDGKPALIGAKLPISYVYQPAQGKNALYLEADLDIAASSAARGILSVTRSYTQVLTINLGFVIQGNATDELPEQMLTGVRLHGIDPLTAPCLPPMDYNDMALQLAAADDASV